MPTYDWRDLLAASEANRPDDPAVLAREARKLAALGLRPRDIEQALRLGPGAAASLLRNAEFRTAGADRK